MGRAAADLIPVLDRMGKEDYAASFKKASELGLIFSQETTDAARAAKEGFREIGDIAEGLARRFTAGFTPALVQSVEQIAKEFEGNGTDAMKKFGEDGGVVFKYLVAGALIFKALVIQMVKEIAGNFAFLGRSAATLWEAMSTGHFKDAQAKFESMLDKRLQDRADNKQDFADAFKRASDFIKAPPKIDKVKPHPVGTGTDGNGTTAEQQSKLENALAARDAAQAENLLAIHKLANQALEAEDKRRYDAGELSLDDYYDRLATKTKAATEEEIAALQGKLTAINQMSEKDGEARAKKEEAQGKVFAEITQAQLRGTTALAAVEQDRGKAKKDLSDQELETIKKLQEAAGDKSAAEQTNLDIETRKYAELLAKQRELTKEQRDAMVNSFKERGSGTIGFAKDQKDASNASANLSEDTQNIQDRAAAGQISNVEAARQILELQTRTLAVMRQIGDQMVLDAELSGDRDKIDAADRYNKSLDNMQAKLKDVSTAQIYFLNALTSQGPGELEDFFSSIMDGQKNASEALKDLANDFEQMVSKMIAKALVFYALEALLGWVGVKSSTITSIIGSSPFGSHQSGGFTANVPENQVAGFVHGQEFVATAAQTRKYRGLFAAIANGMNLPQLKSSSPDASMSVTSQMAIAGNSVAAGAGMAMQNPVQIICPPGTGVKERTTPGPGGSSIKQYILSTVATDVAGGGQVAKAHEAAYGLQRSGVKRGGN